MTRVNAAFVELIKTSETSADNSRASNIVVEIVVVTRREERILVQRGDSVMNVLSFLFFFISMNRIDHMKNDAADVRHTSKRTTRSIGQTLKIVIVIRSYVSSFVRTIRSARAIDSATVPSWLIPFRISRRSTRILCTVND